MTHLLDTLLADHRNLEKVLSVLEQEIALYDTDTNDASPDLPLIMDIMDYLHAYPEFFHHPLEEAAMGYLEARSLGNRAQVNTIRDEHRRLEEEGEELRRLINAINLGRPVSIEKLREALTVFTRHQRRHMEHEEWTIFRSFRLIDQAASDVIRDQLENVRDPIFTEVDEQQFGALLNRLSV